MDITVATFLTEGTVLMGMKSKKNKLSYSAVINRRFRSYFGICPLICFRVWEKIIGEPDIIEIDGSVRPTHLLWALMSMKMYNSQEVNLTIAGVDEKTFRKYTWPIIKAISELDMVSSII